MNQDIDIARQTICDIGKLLYDKGLIAGYEGNISCRVADDKILITPSGVCKGMMRPEQLVVIDFEGNPDDPRQSPSSEFRVHVAAYQNRDDTFALVHAHPNYLNAVSLGGLDINRIEQPEYIATFGEILTVELLPPGSEELAEEFGRCIGVCHTCILFGHGLVAIGTDLWQAFHRIEMAEHCAKTFYLTEQMRLLRDFDEDFMAIESGEDWDDDEDDDFDEIIDPPAPFPPRRRREN